VAIVLEEQQQQRSNINTLHTEIHESKEEVKVEIVTNVVDLKAAIMNLIKVIKSGLKT
jgi:hypothetical protein